MKKIIFSILFFWYHLGHSQNSGEKIIEEKQSNSSAIETLNQANKLAGTDAAKSMKLATLALEKSLSQKDKTAEYHTYNTLGTLYYNIGNYSKAAEYFQRAKTGFIVIKNEKGRNYSEKYLALSLEKQEKFKDALVVQEEAEKRSTFKSKDEFQKKKYEKARLKSKSGKKDEALNDLESLSKEKKVTPETKINIYNELGDIYAEKKDTVSAYNTYYKALNLDNTANSRAVLSTANKSGYLDAANKVSEINIKGNRIAENFVIQNQLLSDGLKSKNLDLVQTANYNIGTTYLQQNNEVKAIPFLFASAKIAKTRNNPIEEQKSVKELAKAYENIGQYEKALDIYKRYVLLSDSFKSLQAGNEESSLALNKEFLKQEQRIRGLMSSQREKEASIRRQRNILYALGTGLILFSVLTWALVRNIGAKKKANMVIKLQSLRTQMNPHFIFNSLNSVNNFISKNDEISANKYISDFSKLMRTVLKNSDKDFVNMVSEIETLQIYLELEHFRFGDKFDYEMTVSEEIDPENLQVPPMLIQPYIENAIWHGLRYKELKGVLEVKFYKENEKLFCTINDNGIGRKKSSELKTDHQKSYQSTGIKNSKERIEILNKLHKTSLGISITDIEEGNETGTFVKISLPYIISEPAY